MLYRASVARIQQQYSKHVPRPSKVQHFEAQPQTPYKWLHTAIYPRKPAAKQGSFKYGKIRIKYVFSYAFFWPFTHFYHTLYGSQFYAPFVRTKYVQNTYEIRMLRVLYVFCTYVVLPGPGWHVKDVATEEFLKSSSWAPTILSKSFCGYKETLYAIRLTKALGWPSYLVPSDLEAWEPRLSFYPQYSSHPASQGPGSGPASLPSRHKSGLGKLQVLTKTERTRGFRSCAFLLHLFGVLQSMCMYTRTFTHAYMYIHAGVFILRAHTYAVTVAKLGPDPQLISNI